jgi:hypothetical protein
MAKQSRKKVRVQYRKFEDLVGALQGASLQDAIGAALKATSPTGDAVGESVKARLYDADPSYGTIVLNSVEEKQSFIFGEIVRFEPGADLPLLQLGENIKEYNLTQAKAPDGHEPIRGVSYFMALGNHVMLLEGDLSAGRAEGYLSWLLTKASGAFDNVHVILAAELNAAAAAQQLSHVDQIIVKPHPVQRRDVPEEGQLVPVSETTSRDVSETNTLEVLRAAGMDDTDIQRLVQDDNTIEVILQIRFKGGRRKRPLGIEDANRLLRNVPDDELTLSGPGGRQKAGKIVKLSYPANVEVMGSLLKRPDVARALHEAFKYFTGNGYIDA